MASNALKGSFIRHVGARSYAQAAPAVARKDAKLQHSVLPNKTFVAALDNGAPVTRVTVAFKAGSRYESPSDLGLAHVLRSAAGLTTTNASSFIIARKLAQAGASVTASGDREFIYYTLEATKENLSPALECLNNLVSNQEFRPWELSDNVPRLKYDIAALGPQVRAVDLLHKAAFRRGLGNSLFISPKKIGKVSSESMQHFACSTLTPARCAVTVVGDAHDRAAMIAQALQLPSGESKGEPGKFFGGELRKETGGDLAHVAIALQGAPAGTPQSLALAIAAKALGNGPVTKWGADLSPLAKAIGNIGPFAAAGFNVSYSDNGLFGVVLSVPKDEANNAIKAVAKVLKSSSLSADAIKAGKSQLKVQLLSEADDGASLAESLAAQGLYTGSVKSPGELAAIIEQISSNDVIQTVGNASKCPLAMASVGNLAFVPYVDELL
ncbi:cytochrome b-c1 complex subunit 2, mitochondrial-like [Choristoneura fumiferana]|uniref:cytochrome b-c1 complex subunit 2, mitochondrial-like n=1 Tax=Choristoneura fumiferana TaxID=7141 RepID=UPI003D15C394